MSPSPTTLQVLRDGGWLHVTLNRPEKRNAMSLAMVEELRALLASVAGDRSVRAIILRGAGGHFCAGGDIADMMRIGAAAESDTGDPIAQLNRQFGHLLQEVDTAGAAVVAVCEGAVMGGGFGLACVADVTIAVDGARFRLPETTLGITPAQIAAFLVRRLGLSQARRLAVTGTTLDARQALTLGLAHIHTEPASVDSALEGVLDNIRKCEPRAVAETKAIMNAVGNRPLAAILDEAAAGFSALASSETAQAGMLARITRQPAPWAQT